MELSDIQALLSVATHGSLQRAAQATGISRTTLRRRLDQLAQDVGAPVVQLSGQQLQLTPAGALLVERGPGLVALRDSLLSQARRQQADHDREVRVLADFGFPPALTAQILAWCSQTHPALRITVHISPDPLNDIIDEYDMMVFWGEQLPQRDGYTRTFLRVPLRLMASPAYLAAHGTPTTLAALQTHRLLLHTSEPDHWPLLGGGQIPVRATYRVNERYVLGCMVGAGCGVGLLPRHGIGVHASMDDLVPVLEDEVGTTTAIRFFAPTRTTQGSAAVLVSALDSLADQYAALG